MGSESLDAFLVLHCLNATMHDDLTGLLNRSVFIDALAQLIQASHDGSQSACVLYLDLDRFRFVNESFGYREGDRLLVALVQRLRDALPPDAISCRLGEDAFGIIVHTNSIHTNSHPDGYPNHHGSSLDMLIGDIQTTINQPFQIQDDDLYMTASIGIVKDPDRYRNADDLMRDAEIAMYQAKASGLGTYTVFKPELYIAVKEQLELEMHIHRATHQQEFELYYQPIFSIHSQGGDRISGFEALLRWQHPKQGLISPGRFIPIAEQTGLIVPIGIWALRQACQQIKQWQSQFVDASSITMSVNLSAKQLLQPDLVLQIQRILDDVSLDPRQLNLEITESTVMENVDAAIEMLKQLKSLGICLSIDDFGTGYSSLGYLHQFPVDTLKLDQSFIQNIDTDAEKIEIIQTVVGLAWNIGLEVVAEGVEKPTQLAQLRSLRCERVQGYFFSKPLNAEDATSFLRKHLQGVLE